MRTMSIAAGALVALMSASCGGGSGGVGPSEQDINNSLTEILRSVAGQWTGLANPPSTMRLDFTLQEGSNGQLTGTGTMKEDSTAAAIPITVTGTFQRPVLTLSFNGMVVESRAVAATMQGSYTTVGGIAATVKLSAPGYARDVPFLLQEK